MGGFREGRRSSSFRSERVLFPRAAASARCALTGRGAGFAVLQNVEAGRALVFVDAAGKSMDSRP